jgi:arylsulfatase A-like enzyme
VRFERAYATAPITLPSHATMMTGRYQQGHGARHNGMRIDLSVPTLADTLGAAGFSTGAFVAAFPLDRRFGLIKGFRTYSDRMPRGARGRLDSERPGREVVDEALAWLASNRGGRFFLWVHLFEPHPAGSQGVHRGSPRGRVPERAHPIGAQRVDRDDDEIARGRGDCWRRGRWTLGTRQGRRADERHA